MVLFLGGLGLLGTGVALAVPAAMAPAGQRLRQLVPAAPVAWQSVFSLADTAKRLVKVPVPPAAPAAPASPPAPPALPVAEAPEAPLMAEVPAAPDAPRLRRLRSGQQGPGSTVIIEKDKKGRLTKLIVDGQPVETQGPGEKTKKSKKTQVEGIQLPMAGGWAVVPGGSGSRVRGWTMGPGVQRFGPETNLEQQAKMLKEQEKLFKQREKLFQQ